MAGRPWRTTAPRNPRHSAAIFMKMGICAPSPPHLSSAPRAVKAAKAHVSVYFINEKLLGRTRAPEALIVHPHAQRTGGNTMRRLVLARLFGPEHVYSRMYKKEPV